MHFVDPIPEQDPFGPDADARYVYLNRAQEELLVSLISEIGESNARLLITGAEGSGKSAFLWKLAEVLYTSSDFVLLGREMVFSCQRDTPIEALETAVLDYAVIRDDLADMARPAVLLLDDADRLDPTVLAALWRRLPELSERWTSISVVMSAMPQPKRLHERSEPDVMAAEKSFKLPPLEPADVEKLIRHRLKVSRYAGSELFTSDALERISYFSKRVPGRIVQLCGYIFSRAGREFPIPVTGDIVKEAAYHLFLPGHLQKLARGLAFPAKPVLADSDLEAHWDLGASGRSPQRAETVKEPTEPARYLKLLSSAARRGSKRGGDRITMPPPPSDSSEKAVAAGYEPAQRPQRFLGSGKRLAALLATAGGVMLLAVTAVVLSNWHNDQRVERTVEARIGPSAQATAGADADKTPSAAATTEGNDETPVSATLPTAPLPKEAFEDEGGQATAQAPAQQTAAPEITATPETAHTGEPFGHDQATDAPPSEEVLHAPGADGTRTDQRDTDQPLASQNPADQTLTTVEARRPPPLGELNTVALVQSHLNALGYAAGPVDGIAGPQTRAAIRRFQADAGLPTDERISDTLIASLRRQAAKANLQRQVRGEKPRRRIMPALRLQLDSVKAPQEFEEYCRANADTWVFDRGKGGFVFCGHVLKER